MDEEVRLSIKYVTELFSGGFSGYDKILAWEPQSGTAALVGSAVAGCVTFLVFLFGSRYEARKHTRTEKRIEANKALMALYRFNNLIDLAVKTFDSVEKPIRQIYPDRSPLSLAPLVHAIVNSLPEPERLDLDEISFLVRDGNADLFMNLLDLERWSIHVINLEKKYTIERLKWDEWALSHADEARNEGVNVHNVKFSGINALEANVKMVKMDTLIKEILRCSLSRSVYEEYFNQYLGVCKDLFPKQFPYNLNIRKSFN